MVGKWKGGAMEMEGEVKAWEMWEQLRRAREGEAEEMADEMARPSSMRVVMWGKLPVEEGREMEKDLETEEGRETAKGLETGKGVEMEESKNNLEDREIEGGQDGGRIQ